MALKLIVNTDGGARGNPGPAGVGVVITSENGQVLKTISQGIGVATNNEAEYKAVILALETLKNMYGSKVHNYDIELRLDSELVQKQLTREYKVKEERLKVFFTQIVTLQLKDVPKVHFVHIPRTQNKIADRLANEAMDAQCYLI
ncbi:MAG: ribonuclease HI family protein [Candidatus Vogelbacteria bacterium]|nr:ribonuclease HI family protein [Candidatus Vogelbacteria bacterium]